MRATSLAERPSQADSALRLVSAWRSAASTAEAPPAPPAHAGTASAAGPRGGTPRRMGRSIGARRGACAVSARRLSGARAYAPPMHVGTVAAIYRYPVKAMAAEVLTEAELGWFGIEGDRRYAFVQSDDTSDFPW